MITRTHALSVVRQCQILGLSRSTAYYQPVSAADLVLMRQIDALHLEYPFAGARMLRDLLRNGGYVSGRRHVATLMRRMGIEAVYSQAPYQPAASGPHGVPLSPAQRGDYPARTMSGRPISPTSRCSAASCICSPSWTGRVAGCWRGGSPNTVTTDFFREAVQEALASYGTPEIFNTDQGCQFTSLEFTSLLKEHGIQISMDGIGCWRDNVFVERLWKSIKYEEVYLHAYETVSAAQQGLERYLTLYNQTRPHRALDGHTPDGVYVNNLPARRTAA